MGSDVIERWRKAVHAWDYADPGEDSMPNVAPATFELREAGDALARELEECRERIRRVEALLQRCTDYKVHPAIWELREALTAPASDEGGE